MMNTYACGIGNQPSLCCMELGTVAFIRVAVYCQFPNYYYVYVYITKEMKLLFRNYKNYKQCYTSNSHIFKIFITYKVN